MDQISDTLFSKEPEHGENPEVYKYCADDQGDGKPSLLRLYFYEGNRVAVIFKNDS